jgi:aspartyl-tRNA(Asn)/glutamyl-tRNA(Gln) amidotransferase subunit C
MLGGSVQRAMSQKIDRAQIEHVAVLASLSLTDAEASKMTEEIGAILKYVDELASLDTSNVPPTAHVQLERADWRPDEVAPGVTHEEALAQAPRAAQDGFAVPAFVES